MDKNQLRLYYKNQLELSYALRDYIDAYFEKQIADKDLEEKLIEVIDANKTKFYKDDEIAKKPKQILGKTRLDILEQILKNKGGKQ